MWVSPGFFPVFAGFFFRFLLVLLILKFVQIFFCSDLKNVHIIKLFKFGICSKLKFVQILNLLKFEFWLIFFLLQNCSILNLFHFEFSLVIKILFKS
jgi:hypothetical protein